MKPLLACTILIAMTASASAQNMSQMGMRGTRNCTTQRCIDNVKQCTANPAQCRNLCTTDRDCGK